MESNLLTPSKIIYSHRKSISLVVDTKGDFFVRAPYRCAEHRIYDFIRRKAEWIIKKRAESKAHIIYPPIQYKNGEKLPIFGEEYIIQLVDSSRVKITDNSLSLLIPNNNPKMKLISFLRRILKKYLSVRLTEIAKAMKVEYLSISISSARTNWGSCSGKNRLHFTYRLAMCPQVVIDYIIVHELCHILVKNHSREFWSRVGQYCPNYKQIEKWLKDNRYIMDII